MNPFGQMSSSHSVWPILLSIYNLPSWLCNKRKYMMMSILILGLHQPGIDIDVYLRPLVYDGSEGIDTYDGYYVAYCSARLRIYRVAVLCPDNVKGKKIVLIA
ncbi:transposon protein, putative, CACTA, En/Spm sub-class [Panicum miliaceum]|uniref:Transposon protein, putative, CACTA, En/Spm sub-class n=1 Tax=Panicum miliaceum TaxID=4540 RepID=A0A3L6RLJ4_PANMI|nr:transposon protein, putative, CACTA, En/Spm sub-class [Panicum miliaceum]